MSEVRVIIQDNLGGTEQITKNTTNTKGVGTTADMVKMQAAINPESNSVSIKQVKAGIAAAVLAKQITDYCFSNVGKWMGDSHAQQQVNNAKDVYNLGLLALANPYAAMASFAFKVGTTAADNTWEQKWDNIASQRKLARAGFDSSGDAIGFRRK